MNIAVIYFSATGNTAKIAKTISEYLKSHEDVNIEEIDNSTIRKLDPEGYSFFSIDTESDYQKAIEMSGKII